ncbi:MAG: hypothetical protein ACXWEY_11575 [Bacteroidia bacterium]
MLELKRIENHGNGPVNYYYAIIVDDDIYEPGKEFEYKKVDNRYLWIGYYWPDESVRGLGYKHTCDANDEVEYHSQDECNSTKPGENGHWKDEGNNSGGGGNNSGVCAGEYQKVGDAQLDAYCGAAYAYRCKDGKPLSDPQVQAVCKTYNDMKEPGVPDCPYCK